MLGNRDRATLLNVASHQSVDVDAGRMKKGDPSQKQALTFTGLVY